jgi:transcriptional regulator with XRE-family HTH domain
MRIRMINIETLKHKKHRAGLSGIHLERMTGISAYKIAKFLRNEDELTEDEYAKIIEACSISTVFDRLFEGCKWKRKFRGKKPHGVIKFRWHIDVKTDVSQAKNKVSVLKEESVKFYRSIYLEDLEDGQVITITEEYWD